MATRNDVTGQEIKTRPSSDAYSANWDAIFGKGPQEEAVSEVEESIQVDAPTT